MVSISLVIINDNAAEYLPQFFKSIKEQKELPANMDIVFVDNCSEDDSVSIAERNGVTTIFKFGNQIQHRGLLYNQGYQLARGKNIIFAHSDILFYPDFFYSLMNEIKNKPQYEFANFAQYYADGYFFGTHQIGLNPLRNGIVYRQLFQPTSGDIYQECSESCFMVNRKVFEYHSFNSCYYNSFFEYDFMCKLNPRIMSNFFQCKITHYFIEQHEKIKTYMYDEEKFIENSFSVVQKGQVYLEYLLLDLVDGKQLHDKSIGIFIFGTGQGGQVLFKYLQKYNCYKGVSYIVKGFFDNNLDKHGDMVEGIMITAPCANIIGTEDYVFIASLNNSCEMEQQLLTNGVERVKIILPGDYLRNLLIES